MCSIVGFCAVANSQQQQRREPGTLKPGFFGRMLGLDSIPNPRLFMKESERVRHYQQQPRFDPTASPRSTQTHATTPMRPLPTMNREIPRATRQVPRSPQPTSRTTAVRRHRTAPSFPAPVITGGSTSTPHTGISITPKRRRSGLTLEQILKNRLSQPITKVERTAPWVQNPFHTDVSDVYQPIASGPVPLPEPETFIVDNDPIEEPNAPLPLKAPMPATTELATPPLATPDTVIVTEPEVEITQTQPATNTTPDEIPEPVEPVTVAEIPEPDQPVIPSQEEVSEPVIADNETITVPDTVVQTPEPLEVAADTPDVETRDFKMPSRSAASEPIKLVKPVYPAVQKQEPVQVAKQWRARTQTHAAPQDSRTLPQTHSATPMTQQAVVQRPVDMRPVSQPTAQPPQKKLPRLAGQTTVRVNPTRSQLPTIRPIGSAGRSQSATRPVAQRTQPAEALRYESIIHQAPVVGAIAHGDLDNPFKDNPERREPVQQLAPAADQFLPPRQPARSAMPVRPEPRSGGKAPAVASHDEPIPLHPIRRAPQPTPQPVVRVPAGLSHQRLQQTPPPEMPIARSAMSVDPPQAAPVTNHSQLEVRPATRRTERPAVTKIPEAVPAKPAVRTRQTAAAPPIDRQTQRRQLIASRPNLVGMKGFCPVELRDNRQLKDSSLEFYSSYGSRTYYFSSANSLAKFVANPRRYVPAGEGRDVVLMTHTGEELQGRLDFAAWYRNRLFLFTSAKALQAFKANPAMYVR
jgi:YHS domain-containing protein